MPAVFLVGFMGSGKTAVGLELSRRLGWRFQDLDERIETRAGKPIAEIFRDSGEAGFRELERSELEHLVSELSSIPTVAALGGGAFAQAHNIALLEQSGGSTIFLEAPLEEMWQRCQSEAKARPLARSQNQFRQLYEARLSFYMRAGLRIPTAGKAAPEVAAEIALRLGLGEVAK